MAPVLVLLRPRYAAAMMAAACATAFVMLGALVASSTSHVSGQLRPAGGDASVAAATAVEPVAPAAERLVFLASPLGVIDSPLSPSAEGGSTGGTAPAPGPSGGSAAGPAPTAPTAPTSPSAPVTVPAASAPPEVQDVIDTLTSLLETVTSPLPVGLG